MAQVKPFKFDTDGFPIELNPGADDLTANSLTVDSGIAMGASKITGLLAGTAATDAVNYGQLQSVAAGFDPKGSCRVRSVLDMSTWTAGGAGIGATLTAPTDAASFNTVDGVLLTVGDRVLVATVADAAGSADVDNGIYEVSILGDGAGASFVLTRTTDFDEDAEVTAGAFSFVTEGTTWADTGWFVTTNDAITVDTTAIQWSQFAGVGTFTAGNGISITAGVIAAVLEAAGVGTGGLAFDAGEIRVDVGDGIKLTAAGVEAALEAAGAATGGLAIDAGEIRVLANTAAGIELLAGGVSVDLAAAGAGTGGLEFVAGEVAANADTASGIELTANGIAANLAAAGAGVGGLEFVGGEIAVNADTAAGIELTANGVAINIEATNPSLQFNAGELGVKINPAGGLEKLAAGLGVNVDGVTISINGSNELEVVGGGSVDQYSLTAGAGGVTIGDPIYVSAADTGLPCDNANNNTRKYAGVAAETVAAAASFLVQQEGVVTPASIGGAPAAGDVVWLDSTSGLTVTLPTGTGTHRLIIGKMKNATDVIIEPQYIAKLD